MLARWWTFGIWALVAGSAVFWGLRVFVPSQAAPAGTQLATAGSALRGDLTRLFGIEAPPQLMLAAETPEPVAVPDPRFTLVGVLSPRGNPGAREGVALIAIDGNPPKAYRVGMRVDGNTVLQAVSARGAQLGPRGGPALVALELPALPAAATGTMPQVTMANGQPFQAQPGGFNPGFAPQYNPNYDPGYAPQPVYDNNTPQPDPTQQADQVMLR